MRHFLIFTILMSLLSSCFKEEAPMPREKIPEGIKISNISLGSNYATQQYYDLSTHQIISENHISDWDIAFECNDTHRIVLNSALLVQIIDYKTIPFDSIVNPPGSENAMWRWDDRKGDLSKTAFGNWGITGKGKVISKQHYYLIDLGSDENGTQRGYKKFRLLAYENGKYSFEYADVDGGNYHIDELLIDEHVNFVKYSFESGAKNLEPPKDQWDLFFSRYRETLITDDGDSIQYVVVGAYLNPYKVSAQDLDSNYLFDELSLEEAKSITLTRQTNIIGHDWKWYNLAEGYYTVREKKLYLLRDTDGILYKLHFLSFLNDEGERGFPKFEYQRLE